jgi:hypothetical protein
MILNMQEPSAFIEVMFIIVPILVALIFIFSIAMILSPKLRGKMMARQIKATKHMIDHSKDDLKDIYTTTADIGIKGKKSVLDENADIMKEMAVMEADINSSRYETMARSLKKGFEDEKNIYCKHCGASIDSDSKFCKKCGKEQ